MVYHKPERRNLMNNAYDVIVIGAGNGGLTAASVTAKQAVLQVSAADVLNSSHLFMNLRGSAQKTSPRK